MKRRRVMALTLCLILALVLTFSSVFAIHEADHDCMGEGCEICAQIAASVDLLRGLTLMAAVLLTLFAALPAVPKHCGFSRRTARPEPTPTSWKVRLNN